MGRKSVAVLPQTQSILEQLGEQIKLARLRRHLSAELVAERAGVSRSTVWNVEKGNPSVAIGIYAAVLHALSGILFQPFGVLRRSLTALPRAHDYNLLELFELSVCKTPDGDILKIIAEDTANIRRQTVVRDHIQQQAAVQQMWDALDKKPLFVPRLAAALVENGEIRRVQEQQVERLTADVAMEKAAEAYTVQTRLRLLRTAFIQLYTIGIAVVALCDLPQCLSAATAGVKDIGGHALRERDTLQHQRDILRIGGIVPQLHVVHEPPNGGRADGVFLRKLLCEPADRIIYRTVAGAHQVEALKAPQQLPGHGCQSVALQLHQQRLCVGQRLCQIVTDAAERVVGIMGGG